MRREKEPKCGQKFRDKQAIAELSTEPMSNHTLTVTATRTVICLILYIMNIINSLFSIVLCVGGCACAVGTCEAPTVANLGCKLVFDTV